MVDDEGKPKALRNPAEVWGSGQLTIDCPGPRTRCGKGPYEKGRDSYRTRYVGRMLDSCPIARHPQPAVPFRDLTPFSPPPPPLPSMAGEHDVLDISDDNTEVIDISDEERLVSCKRSRLVIVLASDSRWIPCSAPGMVYFESIVCGIAKLSLTNLLRGRSVKRLACRHPGFVEVIITRRVHASTSVYTFHILMMIIVIDKPFPSPAS
ncbi:hypothetical protein BDZ89DRAFT_717703 [Hymenopellis radicata]|nr:hypothetical protein BDZ89DRAFT_717703 [Hymenopellis radicata]